MQIQKIYIGGWFQRTTLHLTETWRFLNEAKSDLDFSKGELQKARNSLAIASCVRESGPLEYITVTTDKDINYRIYEDGLIVLEKKFGVLKDDFNAIRSYYDTKLSKALSLIFSKGAPVPKELANIKSILPYIVVTEGASKEDVQMLFDEFKEDLYSTLSSEGIEVYRSVGIIVINNLRDETLAREIIESQIFFREFKTQLHRYLSIHRIIWEKIAKIKELGAVSGNDIDRLRGQLSDYQKTITLISSRIDQMGTYIRTRQKVSSLEKIDERLNPLFQLKFETLQDTHEYIKHLWKMTLEYLRSAIEMVSDLQNKSTKNTISSLQLITTIGVVAGILGYLTKDALPKFTPVGLFYFVLLLALTWLINTVVSRAYKSKKYRLKGSEVVKDIK